MFILYLGRKSCPLAFPVVPKIVLAENPAKALEQVELPPWQVKAKADILATTPEVLQSERTIRTELRYDQPTDRKAWHFALRPEAVVAVKIRPGGAG